MTRSIQIHACAASFNGQGILIKGAPGSGKTSLLIALFAKGFDVIADDQVQVYLHENQPWVSAHEKSLSLIEFRNIGIYKIEPNAPAPLELILDLDEKPDGRIPADKTELILNKEIELIFANGVHNVADYLYLRFNQKLVKHTL